MCTTHWAITSRPSKRMSKKGVAALFAGGCGKCEPQAARPPVAAESAEPAMNPPPTNRKRPAAAMGEQTQPSHVAAVWQWRCRVRSEADQLGVAMGGLQEASLREVAEALQPGAKGRNRRAVTRSKTHVSAEFEMPSHCSRSASYLIEFDVKDARVEVHGPGDPRAPTGGTAPTVAAAG